MGVLIFLKIVITGALALHLVEELCNTDEVVILDNGICYTYLLGEVLSSPVHPALGEEEIAKILGAIRKIMEKRRKGANRK